MTKRLLIALAAGLLAVPAAAPAQRGQAPRAPVEARIVAEARSFMAAYARDLVAGDRKAVAARYDRRGTHVVIAGTARLESHAAISAIYGGPGWSALPRFAWHDLMYIPTGPDAIVVAGRFSVQPASAPKPIFYSYSNLLVRQDRQLRIRMEHETPEPTPR